MEYPAGSILGTEVTASLREAGFKGVVAIRSANDEPASRKMYDEAGASGYLCKDAKGAKLTSDLLRIYTRVFRMGLCGE
jgi:DNA-binding NarL/FixJ family response regulator